MGYSLTRFKGIWILSCKGEYTGYSFEIEGTFTDLEQTISICGIRAMYHKTMSIKEKKDVA